MPFGHRTPNETGRLRRKPQIILGHDVDAYQFAAWAGCGAAFLAVAFTPQVSFFWKAAAAAVLLLLAAVLSRKDGEGRTVFRVARIMARRAAKGAKSVDRGADRSYYQQTKR